MSKYNSEYAVLKEEKEWKIQERRGTYHMS